MKRVPGLNASRREFMAASLAASVATGAAAPASSLQAPTLAAAGRTTVILHDTRIAIDRGVAQRLLANGARIVPLEGDLVRMWRNDPGLELNNTETRLMGLTRWADLLLVRGLAAESRRHLRFERHDAQSDAFTWLIA